MQYNIRIAISVEIVFIAIIANGIMAKLSHPNAILHSARTRNRITTWNGL